MKDAQKRSKVVQPTEAERKAQIDRLQKSLADWDREYPPEPPLTDAQKKQKLEEIKGEINDLYSKIGDDHRAARKLICNSVHHAKRIGDKLRKARGLLKHGEYEIWVKENFDGKPSTARAYSRIAKQENWEKIAPKLQAWGSMTIEQALNLLKKQPKEKSPASKKNILVKMLVERFGRLVKTWPLKPLARLAHDLPFMELVEETARERNNKIRKHLAKHTEQEEGAPPVIIDGKAYLLDPKSVETTPQQSANSRRRVVKETHLNGTND